MLIALFILSLSEKNAELKETIKYALDFYRQNRELLTALAGTSRSPSQASEKTEQQKSSSDVGGDSLRMIEEFLKHKPL